MISPNSSGVWRRPFAMSVRMRAFLSGAGDEPTVPSEACTFCALMAATISSALMPWAAQRLGSSHTRIAILGPWIEASPTPGTRRRAGCTTPYM